MKKSWIILTLILAVGTLFAWYTVYNDFSLFYNLEGTVLKINNCAIPNPVTTPCFYGAFAFLIAFIWSIMLLRKPLQLALQGLKKLLWLLVASVLFAWGNFVYSLITFYQTKDSGQAIGCSGQLVTNPWTTPCFIGACIFLTALVVAVILYRRK
ncbi:MAG: hypothetical protein V1846_02790 [Candidatus Komeilibacteria bacterium]